MTSARRVPSRGWQNPLQLPKNLEICQKAATRQLVFLILTLMTHRFDAAEINFWRFQATTQLSDKDGTQSAFFKHPQGDHPSSCLYSTQFRCSQGA